MMFAGEKPEEKEEKEVIEIDPHALAEAQVHMEPITTNLLSPNNFIVIALSVQLSDSDAKYEFEARLPEMKSLAISTFNSIDKKTLTGGSGTAQISETLMSKFNEKISHGEVSDIYITDFKLQ
jgi:flagellar basal body-associated protein FliL